MLRPLITATAAVVLLAGCSGGDDKASESSSGGDNGQQASTPTTPAAPSFDPPKAFTAAAAYPVPDFKGRELYDEPKLGMVGQVAVVANYRGLTGRDVVDPSKAWEIESTAADTTTVSDVTDPMAVKVDGKDVAVIAYGEADKGNGTQKPQGLVLVQWIDVASGQKLAEVSTPVSTVNGTGIAAAGLPSLIAAQYDPETGQVAIGVTARGNLTVKTQNATVYADPQTKKSTVVPDVVPGAVHNGVVAGAKQESKTDAGDAGVLLIDGATGKVTQQIPLKQGFLKPLPGGAKHAFFYGTVYAGATMSETASLFSVNLSTGAVVRSAPGLSARDSGGYDCTWDQVSSIVCREAAVTGPQEILGFDDSTGKKAWGFTSESGGRVVPRVTAAFHGVVYVQTEKQPVLLDAKTGQDLPSASTSGSPSASSSDSPSAGDTPSGNDSPTAGDTPSDSRSAGGSDMSLYDGKLVSPDAVSPYGGVYGQLPNGGGGYGSGDLQSVLVYLKPTA
ncbi:hypothetical protein E0H75_05835 [Kribbella capetownensis]|uniref:Uncharacterized protein n=1 Tax=Kribbella capetownensis TaxID=1572659 RepID=A0A4V2M8X5_9ACTN|nr:hypothetical protein [Kribbella capetownensis]TCC53232.1 hypothetical protein E0H75_05835 [Kribbella capetownensis]